MQFQMQLSLVGYLLKNGKNFMLTHNHLEERNTHKNVCGPPSSKTPNIAMLHESIISWQVQYAIA